MSKKNLLFICGKALASSSQGVRYRNLLPNLAKYYSVTLLSGYKIFDSPEITNISISTQTEPPTIAVSSKEQSGVLKKMKGFYKKYLRPFVFPDKSRYKIPVYKKAIKKLLDEKEYDAVIVAMTPYSFYVLPKFIKEQNSSIKTVIDLSDPFLNNAGTKYAFIYSKKYVENFERKNLSYVNNLVVLNPSIKQFYHKIYGIKNINVVEQGLNENVFRKAKLKAKKNNKPILVYGGGLYHRIREPFELYAAVNQLKQNVEFRIFGNINESLQPKPSEKIKYYGPIDQDSLADEFNSADVIIFIDNAKGMQVPGKILELLALCKPVLFIYSNPESPTLYYASESEWIIKVKNSREEIIKGIEKILSSKYDTIPAPDISAYYWKNLAKSYTRIING